VSEIALPVDYVTTADPVVAGSTVWLAGSADPGGAGAGGRTFSLLGVDLATGTVAQLPTEAIVANIDVIDGVAWVVLGSDTRSVQPFTTAGPTSSPTPIAADGTGGRGEAGRLVTITPAGTFDCIVSALAGGQDGDLRSDWRVTPHGGETTALGPQGEGCNAVPVGDQLLHADGDRLLRLSVDGVTEVALPEPMQVCDGPRQATGAPALLVCRTESTGSTVVLRVVDTSATATRALDLGSGLEVRSSGDIPPTSGPGRPLALLAEDDGTGSGTGRGILVGQDAAGNPAAGAFALDDTDLARWFGDDLWLATADGTWRQVADPPGAS
jgi:hypothetical protein